MNHVERKSGGLRVISTLLIVCLLLSFSACGSGKAENPAQPSEAGVAAAEQSPEATSSVPPETDGEYIKRLVDNFGTSSIATWNGRLYAARNNSLFTLEGDSMTELYTVDADEISAFDVCGEGIWCLSKNYTDTGDVFFLEQIAFDGSLISSAELTEIPGYDPELGEPQDIKAYGGLIYLPCLYAIAIFNQSENSFSDAYRTDNILVASVVKNSDGVAIFTVKDDNYALKYIDHDAEIKLPTTVISVFDAPDENYFYYDTAQGLYRLFPDASSETVVIWSESALANTWLIYAAPLGDGFALLDEWEVYLLQPGETQR